MPLLACCRPYWYFDTGREGGGSHLSKIISESRNFPTINTHVKLSIPAIPGPDFEYAGHRYLYFGGTSYLGMQLLPEFRELLAGHIRRLGTHWGGSRSGNLVPDVYEKTERQLAAWAGSPAALTLSSGFIAGRLLSDYFIGSGYHCFFGPSCHAALLPAGHNRAPNWDVLANLLHAHEANKEPLPAVVFTDTLDFSDGPEFLASKLRALAGPGRILVADDSHGLGLLGNGAGAYRALAGTGFKETLVCGSLGKAMGITGGLVLGPLKRIDDLRQNPVFSGASPAPPAALAAISEALDAGLYSRQLQKLHQRIAYFDAAVDGSGILKRMENYPVYTFRLDALAEYLQRQRILITHFPYPGDGSKAPSSRIVLNPLHSNEHLDRLAVVLRDFTGS